MRRDEMGQARRLTLEHAMGRASKRKWRGPEDALDDARGQYSREKGTGTMQGSELPRRGIRLQKSCS